MMCRTLAVVAATTLAASGASDIEEKLAAAHAASRGLPVAERLVRMTDPLVGAPYVLSPLGEGEGVDADPRIRFDAFDCTTFVETAMAMSVAEAFDSTQEVLDRIRYHDDKPDFLSRRHFPAAEWLPELIALGLLDDITGQIAGDDVIVAKKKLSPAVWNRRRKKILDALPEDRIPRGTFSLPVWPIQAALKGRRKIPPGTLLSVVRADYRSIPVRVSHQGLVIRKDGELFLRHAADRKYHRVVDEPLSWFLGRVSKYKKWPVTGVHLAKINDRTPADLNSKSPG